MHNFSLFMCTDLTFHFETSNVVWVPLMHIIVVEKTKVTKPDENQADKTSEARVDETDATATITDQADATAAVVNQVETPKTVVDQTDVLASNADQTDVTTTVVDSQDDASPNASADVPATTLKPN